MELEKSKAIPWCRQLFLLKRNSKIQELEIKVRSIVTNISGVEEWLQKIICDCERSVKNMRMEEASFSECSTFLQNWDDKLTIYRSELVQFMVDLPNHTENANRQKDGQGLKDNFLLEKISRKFEEVCESIHGLRTEIEAIRRILTSLLKNIPEVSGKDEDLEGEFLECIEVLRERNLEVMKIWKAICTWESVLKCNPGLDEGQKDINLDKVTVTEFKKEIDREMCGRLPESSLQYHEEVDKLTDSFKSIRVKNVKIAPRMSCQKNPPVSGGGASVADSGILSMSATDSGIVSVDETEVTEERFVPQYKRWSTITGYKKNYNKDRKKIIIGE